MKLVREMIGRSKDFEDVGRVVSTFPAYLGKIERRLCQQGRNLANSFSSVALTICDIFIVEILVT